MRLQVPARSHLGLEFSWDKQNTPILQIFTRSGELVTALYVQNLFNHKGELLLDSASGLVLDRDTVEDIKNWLFDQEAKLEEIRATKAAASKARKAREPREAV